MSYAKRRRVCASSETESAPPHIPIDLLLDILARTDVGTVVRCAATSKPVRRAIVGPGFRVALAALRATDRAGGGFDPDLLLGFTYAHRERSDDPVRVEQAPPKNLLRFYASLLETFDPVAVRGGLVVLRQRQRQHQQPHQSGASDSDLLVCNSLTGDMVRLPPAAVVWDGCPPALLTVGDAGRSFELLVSRHRLRPPRIEAQTFSSKNGKWAAAVDIRYSLRHWDGEPSDVDIRYWDVEPRDGSHPVVLGGTLVHWLCRRYSAIKVLDMGTAQATQILLPRGFTGNVKHVQSLDSGSGIVLATSADGRLGLLVSERLYVSMWTLEEGSSAAAAAARWARQVVVRWQPIIWLSPSCSVDILGFGERSGAVILQIDGLGLFRLNLGAKEVVVVDRELKLGSPDLFRLCLHETDLSSLLQAMKPF